MRKNLLFQFRLKKNKIKKPVNKFSALRKYIKQIIFVFILEKIGPL